MKKIVKLTESDLVNIIKKIINEETNLTEGSVSIKNPNFTITADGSGWLKDGKNNLMCVKVDAPWPIGTFAQGIKNIIPKKDGGATIIPTGSKIGNIEITGKEFLSLATSILNGSPYRIRKSGSDISIGKSIVPFCKKDWGS
jgi:hypothetical protein